MSYPDSANKWQRQKLYLGLITNHALKHREFCLP